MGCQDCENLRRFLSFLTLRSKPSSSLTGTIRGCHSDSACNSSTTFKVPQAWKVERMVDMFDTSQFSSTSSLRERLCPSSWIRANKKAALVIKATTKSTRVCNLHMGQNDSKCVSETLRMLSIRHHHMCEKGRVQHGATRIMNYIP